MIMVDNDNDYDNDNENNNNKIPKNITTWSKRYINNSTDR